MKNRHAGALAALTALALAPSCGNGGSSDSSGNPPGGDTTAPIVTVAFPPAGSLTDAAVVRVFGTAGDPSGVADVRVNGVAAVTSDGFSTWSVSVPLQPGANTLRVLAQDGRGNTDTRALEWSVTRGDDDLVAPVGLAFDPGRGRLLVADPGLERLAAVAPLSGAVQTVSGASSQGPPLLTPSGMDVDTLRDRVIVVDRERRELVTVGLADGRRELLSDPNFSGPFDPIDVVVDPLQNLAFCTEINTAVRIVDLTTGMRTPLGGSPGIGVGLRGIAIDRARGRLLVTSSAGSPVLLAFDMATGSSSVVSGSGVGTGPDFQSLADVVIDPVTNRAVVSDPRARTLLSVDLDTGNRTEVSGPATGSGPPLSSPDALHVDAVSGLFVVDTDLDALLRVDLRNGDRVVLAGGTRVGTGVALRRPVAAAPSSSGLMVLDGGLGALVEVDDETRERRLFSGAGVGVGPELTSPTAIELDLHPILGAPQLLGWFVADAGRKSILRVDAAGDRTVISGEGVGAGPELRLPRDLALCQIGFSLPCSLVVADCPAVGTGQLLDVDPTTGNRRVLVDLMSPSPTPAVLRPVAVTFSPTRTLLVLDEAQDALFEVDLDTGMRTLLSPPGLGPAFSPDGAKDLLLDVNRNRVVVADASSGRLIAVSLTGGNRTEVFGPAQDAGPVLVTPSGLAPGPPPLTGGGASGDSGLATLRVVDASRGAVLAVGPDGSRVLWSE